MALLKSTGEAIYFGGIKKTEHNMMEILASSFQE
jgi:hypothetical protein